MKYEFKKGDKVRRINENLGGLIVGETGVVVNDFSSDYENQRVLVRHDKDGKEVEHFARNLEIYGELVSNISKTPQKMDIEKLKTFNAKNLAVGKKLAEAELAEYEAQEAKKAYLELMQKKEQTEEAAEKTESELKELDEMLGVFKSK